MSTPHTPYFGKSSITPDFSRPKNSKNPAQIPPNPPKSPNTPAKSILRSAEHSSLQPSIIAHNFKYVKTPQQISRPTPQKNPSKSPLNPFKSLKKSKAPLAAIGILFAAVFFIFTSFTSLLGFQIDSLITSLTDTQHTSHSLRKPFLMKKFLKNSDTNSPNAKYSNLPKKLQSRFKKQGIEVGFTNSQGQFIPGEPPKGTPFALKHRDQIITDLNYDDIMKSDALFIDASQKAARKRAANFFDPSANHHYRKLNISRNDFARFQQTGDNATDTKSYQTIMNRKFATDSDIKIGIAEDQTTTNEQGEPETRRITDVDVSTTTISGDTPSAKAKSYLDHLSSKTSGATFGCMALKVGNMVNTAINSLETYQAINFFMSLSENISKAKAGAGHQSAIHPIMNFFQTSTETTVHDIKTNRPIKITGTPLESEGLKSVLTGTPPNKSAVLNFSSERSTHSLKNSPALQTTSATACSTATTAGSIISLATFAAPGSGLIKISVGLLKNTVLAIGTQVALAGTLAILIPTVAETMFTNRFAAATGKPAGELFTKGAIAANTKLARSGSGQTPSSKSAVLAFQATTNHLQSTEQTTTNLLTKNHFNPQNPHTFLGALTTKFQTLRHTASPSQLATNLHTLALRSAQTSLTANVLAATPENSSLLTTFGDCPLLESIGAVGDIYCNPIPTSDPSTLQIDPTSDRTYQAIINKNLTTKSGKQKILDNSPLANFILFCAERDSPFGAIDANIHNAMQHSLGVVGDNLPILNDLVDIVNAAEDVQNLPWATGAICINSPDNPRWDSEFKYYQRFIEDNRLLDQLGANDELDHNPVLAFKNHHESLHPIDRTPAGTLARLTGLTKFDAAGLIALHDHQALLAHYHPHLTHQFSSNISSPPHPQNHQKLYSMAPDYPHSITLMLKSQPPHTPPIHHLLIKKPQETTA